MVFTLPPQIDARIGTRPRRVLPEAAVPEAAVAAPPQDDKPGVRMMPIPQQVDQPTVARIAQPMPAAAAEPPAPPSAGRQQFENVIQGNLPDYDPRVGSPWTKKAARLDPPGIFNDRKTYTPDGSFQVVLARYGCVNV